MRNPLKPLGQRILETEESVKKKHAIDIVRNEVTAHRVKEMGEEVEYIGDPTYDINARVVRLNKLVVVAGWAWAAAGDNEFMDGQLTRWNKAVGYWHNRYSLIKPREDRDRPEYEPRTFVLQLDGHEFEVIDDLSIDPFQILTQEELRYLVVAFGETNMIPAGMTILHRTFKDKHVAEAYVAMYQGMPSTEPRRLEVGTASDTARQYEEWARQQEALKTAPAQ